MSDTSPKQPPRRSGSWLLNVAMVLFTTGLLAIVAIFGIGILTDSDPGLWLYLLAMAAPLGFLLAIGYALWSGRRAR
ncbi:hypothetical protein [Nocardia crassostreae]|uniref:hypothetical protein n=1 Tax=Nocardia crassostreae TaxID=53428 RepID=UPI000834BEFE|nr:hypothetical protein [Nocardia crassostreae]